MHNLKKFFQLYIDWVDDGALEPTILGFIRGSGLCDNLRLYSKMMGNDSNVRGLTECHLNPKRIAWIRQQLNSGN